MTGVAVPTRSADIVVVTRNLDLAHAVAVAAPGEWTESQPSFGSALAAIRQGTRLLVVDAAIDSPLARLLVTAFVDQRPGRRAVLVQAPGDLPLELEDERITVLASRTSAGVLTQAVGNPALAEWMSDLEASLAEEPVAV